MIYLDNAATTAPRREAIEAMWPYLTSGFGNPSSRHRVGAEAAAGLKAARKSVAESLGARASEIIFTSGGTEADNLAIKGMALANPRGKHIVTTRLEHAAVLESVDYLVRFHDFEVSFAEPDEFGRITPAALEAVLRPDTTLVSIHFANNEIGTIQPIRELASDVPFHTDAVQAAGWVDINVRELGIDALSLSGHKLGAPKGIGVLWVRGPVALEPVLHGGGQERGARSGTENVAGAVALATALRLSLHDDHLRTTQLRDKFVHTVLNSVPGARLTGHPTERVPGSASFVFEGVGGEAVLLELEERGIMCSSGSACDADSEDASPVLLAIGIPEDLARTAVRFTFSPSTTEEEASAAARAVVDTVAAVRGLG
ncbi:cysteine desulfurase family protein [Corynebacterium lubricantis]|uniref:cysteine desulfurase family protein n=1 Tax=Corynebacterium lubricantis TaxID=541095 RepID=UPI000365274C|nr:cysteine desulfurase family protein [Corynebacterium lubricantis]